MPLVVGSGNSNCQAEARCRVGTTAAREIAGRPITVSRERGRLIRIDEGCNALATNHPAAILRIKEETSRNDAYMAFVSDLKLAKRLVKS